MFPGGRIDVEDYPAAAREDHLAAARQAAVREAEEEAGLILDPAGLVFLSHWTTPEGRPHRFSTWFFVTAAGSDTVRIDGGEIHAHQWMQPIQALAAQRDGTVELPPPTFVTLQTLSAYGSVEEALTRVAAQPPITFKPRF